MLKKKRILAKKKKLKCRFVQDAQMVKKCHFLYVTTYFIYPSYQMVTYISQEYPSNFFKNEIWLSTSNMLHKK